MLRDVNNKALEMHRLNFREIRHPHLLASVGFPALKIIWPRNCSEGRRICYTKLQSYTYLNADMDMETLKKNT